MKPDQKRVSALLIQTVSLLCKNGLHFDKSLHIQGLLGITVDEKDVFIVQLDDTLLQKQLNIPSPLPPPSLSSASSNTSSSTTSICTKLKNSKNNNINIKDDSANNNATVKNSHRSSKSEESDPNRSNNLNLNNSNDYCNTNITDDSNNNHDDNINDDVNCLNEFHSQSIMTDNNNKIHNHENFQNVNFQDHEICNNDENSKKSDVPVNNNNNNNNNVNDGDDVMMKDNVNDDDENEDEEEIIFVKSEISTEEQDILDQQQNQQMQLVEYNNDDHLSQQQHHHHDQHSDNLYNPSIPNYKSNYNHRKKNNFQGIENENNLFTQPSFHGDPLANLENSILAPTSAIFENFHQHHSSLGQEMIKESWTYTKYKQMASHSNLHRKSLTLAPNNPNSALSLPFPNNNSLPLGLNSLTGDGLQNLSQSMSGGPRRRSNLKTVVCQYPDCGKTFCHSCHLYRHQRLKHGRRFGVVTQTSFHCQFSGCGKVFYRRASLVNHNFNVHNIGPPPNFNNQSGRHFSTGGINISGSHGNNNNGGDEDDVDDDVIDGVDNDSFQSHSDLLG